MGHCCACRRVGTVAPNGTPTAAGHSRDHWRRWGRRRQQRELLLLLLLLRMQSLLLVLQLLAGLLLEKCLLVCEVGVWEGNARRAFIQVMVLLLLWMRRCIDSKWAAAPAGARGRPRGARRVRC